MEMENNQSIPEINSSSEGTNHIYSPKASVLGTSTLHLTSSSESEGFTKEDLEISLTKCTNQQCVIGSNKNEYDTEDDHVSVKSATGINKTPLCEMGLNIDNTDTGMIGVNSTPPTADNMSPNNDDAKHCSIDNCASSSSSDFDGFTQEDLKLLPSMVNLDSDTNSSPFSLYSSEESESEHYDYETDIFSSNDTILYQVPIPTTETYVKKSSATAPIPLVEEMWRTEALTRKYSVPLNKLNKREIYDLSHPPPDWDNIDPYSGLEDHSDDENNNPKKTNVDKEHIDSPKTEFAREPYHMRTCQIPQPSSRKSGHENSRIVSYAESDLHSSNSDYEPHTRPVRNSNVGLREPTQSRLRAQRLISASNAEKHLEKFPV